MLRKSATLTLLFALLVGSGCAKKAALSSFRGTAAVNPVILPEFPELKRYIAVRHKLEIIAPESDLPKAWESVINFCGTIHCEVLSSSITTRTRDSAPSGAISLRVLPEDLNKLLAEVEKRGKIAQHTTETEDKTAVVIDTDANLKNLTGLRDSLRTMMAKPSLNV